MWQNSPLKQTYGVQPVSTFIRPCSSNTSGTGGMFQFSYKSVSSYRDETLAIRRIEHSNSGKKVSMRFYSILATESIFSIRFGNLINLPLVHLYSNSKLGVIFIVCIALHWVTLLSMFYTVYSFQLRAFWCILIINNCIWCVCVIYLVQKLHDN